MTAPTPSLRDAAQMALLALDESIDDVLNEYEIRKAMYENMPTRQGKVAGLKAGVDAHWAAIDALTAALALPEAEPVAGVWGLYDDFKRLSALNRAKHSSTAHEKWKGMELAYTAAAQKIQQFAMRQPAPIERQPLTDAQITGIYFEALGAQRIQDASLISRLVRAVEAAHGVGAA